MAVSMNELLADLAAETEVVTAMIADLDDADVALPTPAAGWSVRDQLSHLAYFDETATTAAVDPERFRREAAELVAKGYDFPDRIAAEYAGLGADALRQWLRRARAGFIAALRDVAPKARVPWYGPDMSAASSVTARLMETWAHGQDIADALGVVREPTDRLRHIAHLGVQTAGFSFQLNGRPVPTSPVRVELVAPSGGLWEWGPADAPDRVLGTALDFCLVVTQRRNVADTALEVIGDTAREWIPIAQAFAGAPGPGRPPAAGHTPMETGRNR
ncbi:TIGR03084 family metal-binding protein [Amycolatopsis sp.]|uniref:TIGR03084 family metal-binding protein n=1 Tax=Amycolatopsis sp. TaxID=37632 RepID=UPI002E07F223|nr:TIGR03084 family metal-binding protein [Amycolatopsis sp.]